jgi:acyl carrier protein
MENPTSGVIREFLRKRFPLVRERALSDDDSLLESGAVDSLGVLDIVTFLEEKFGIQVADEELDPGNFDSVSSLARLVEGKRA